MATTTELAEDEEFKRDGRAIRRLRKREFYAECAEESCPKAWTGPSAFLASSAHVIGSGHTVLTEYHTWYELRYNPNEDDHKPYGRAKRTTVIIETE